MKILCKCIVGIFLFIACTGEVQKQKSQSSYPGLENVFPLSSDVWSGSQPKTAEAFSSLEKLKIKTVISVDQNLPSQSLAQEYKMKYIHLPIHYYGISPQREKQLIQAFSRLPKPIYIHCFQGQHRSVAAGVFALLSIGSITRERAVSLLKEGGTSPVYSGLHKKIERAKVLSSSTIEELQEPLPEKVEFTSFRSLMVNIGRHYKQLQKMKEQNWQTPADHPDLQVVHQLSIIQSYLAKAVESPQLFKKRPEDFSELLQEAKKETLSLQKDFSSIQLPELEKRWWKLDQSCQNCHQKYRDE